MRVYYANMLPLRVREHKLYLGLTWIFMYHSYVVKMDLRTALENVTSVHHVQLTKRKCVTTKHILITYFNFLFPLLQEQTKTTRNKPFQHSMIFSWVFLMHKMLTRPRHYSSSSRFVWLSWWAQKSSLQVYYATVLPIKKNGKKMQA